MAQQYRFTPVAQVLPVLFLNQSLALRIEWIENVPSPYLLVDATNSPVSQAPAQAGAVPDQ
jgi:hypothetical protein